MPRHVSSNAPYWLLPLLLSVACGQVGDPEEESTASTATSTPTHSPSATELVATNTPETPTEDPTDAGPGTINIQFQMNEDWIGAMDEGEEPIGRFWGAVYDSEEVTGAGPILGATILETIYVEEVDLRDGGGPTEVLYTTSLIPSIDVTILGFLDTDNNAEDYDTTPDYKDPVTLPGDNEFEVIGGETITATVYFGLLNP